MTRPTSAPPAVLPSLLRPSPLELPQASGAHPMRSRQSFGDRSAHSLISPRRTSTEDGSHLNITSPSTSQTTSTTMAQSGPTSLNTSDAGEPWSMLGDRGRAWSGGKGRRSFNVRRPPSEGSDGQLPSRPALHALVEDGEQSYQWADGGEYFGEWRQGHPHGRGTYISPDGDEYEGEWRYGKESGAGTLIKPNGSRFYGFWLRGQRHGEGMYTPASVGNRRAEVLYLQQWDKNVMREECVLRVAEDDIRRKQQKKEKKLERKSHANREGTAGDIQHRDGETIYKGHHSYELMRDLQRGITFSIARAGREEEEQRLELPPEDFTKIVTQQFPRMAEHKSFKWKDYCPAVFARLRETFGIDTRDYLLSLTGDKALRELPSPGKSGSVFFMSDDDRFLIKTVRKDEMHLLLLLIPQYYRHCKKHPDTLLTRFYGVHRVKPILGGTVRFVVMGNCLPTDVRLHRKYDLKGSTYGRTAGMKAQNPNAILKDLDLDLRLQLDPRTHQAMMQQIDADVALLEQLHVMDYSLLLGVHYKTWGDSQWQPPAAHQAYKSKGINLNPLAPLVRNMVGADPKHIFSGKAHLNKGQDVKAVYGKDFEQDPNTRRSDDEGSDLSDDEEILTGDHRSEREPPPAQGMRRSSLEPATPETMLPAPQTGRHSNLPRLSSEESNQSNPVLDSPPARALRDQQHRIPTPFSSTSPDTGQIPGTGHPQGGNHAAAQGASSGVSSTASWRSLSLKKSQRSPSNGFGSPPSSRRASADSPSSASPPVRSPTSNNPPAAASSGAAAAGIHPNSFTSPLRGRRASADSPDLASPSMHTAPGPLSKHPPSADSPDGARPLVHTAPGPLCNYPPAAASSGAATAGMPTNRFATPPRDRRASADSLSFTSPPICMPASPFSNYPPAAASSGAATAGMPPHDLMSPPQTVRTSPGVQQYQRRSVGARPSSEPALQMVGGMQAARQAQPTSDPGQAPLDTRNSLDGSRRGSHRQVAFREDHLRTISGPSLNRTGSTSDLDIRELARLRGTVGSHSFTAAAADPLLRQRQRRGPTPRRSTSLLPNGIEGMRARMGNGLPDGGGSGADSGDDSPLRRRSSRRLCSLHSLGQPRLGCSTTAMAVSQPRLGESAAAHSPDGPGGGEKVMLYFGIIDFLQEYTLRKRMEHAMKRTVVDGKTISVVDPHQYAKRFKRSMRETFVSNA
ncbi:hypothetical protein WJX84_003964 [Apatococcus fuscideae]|uniref:1-phosphatidylinositol-4-phosphate 5-kinase n=1 Tax=Apatococcus fuscideae TaxID=2026836 RepID=A0AAW1TKZ2_9CHLO